MEFGKTLTDKLKSKVGVGNDGKLMSPKDKTKKSDKEDDEDVSEQVQKLREKWYSRMGLKYDKETID